MQRTILVVDTQGFAEFGLYRFFDLGRRRFLGRDTEMPATASCGTGASSSISCRMRHLVRQRGCSKGFRPKPRKAAKESEFGPVS
jgi:hypothetical protein